MMRENNEEVYPYLLCYIYYSIIPTLVTLDRNIVTLDDFTAKPQFFSLTQTKEKQKTKINVFLTLGALFLNHPADALLC